MLSHKFCIASLFIISQAVAPTKEDPMLYSLSINPYFHGNFRHDALNTSLSRRANARKFSVL